MLRSIDRILTTHVGSLPRPKDLLGVGAVKAGESSVTDNVALQKAVVEIVKKQADVGLDLVNDGEFGKATWANYILNRISGFEIQPERRMPLRWLGRDAERFPEFFNEQMPKAMAEGTAAEVCVGPISYTDRSFIERDVANMQEALKSVSGVQGFVTAVAPASTAYDGINEYYASDEEYAFAIADALYEEYMAIHNAGLFVQVDDAVLANMYDTLTQESPERYRKWAQIRIDALNHALRDIPPERVRYHLCFGSWHVPHTSDAPLSEVVDLILQVNAGGYAFEAANVRHEHEWKLWEEVKLPEGKTLIPGVITHHTVSVEHPELVADRILRFANLVGRESVIAGTDCGFAQGESITRVHPSIMWAKFESLVQGAEMASKKLW